MDDTTYLAPEDQHATPAICCAPGCEHVATIRRVTAEPFHWELGELEPLTVTALLCDQHASGINAPENA